MRIALIVLSAVLLALLVAGLFVLVWDGDNGEIVGTGDTQEFSVSLRPDARTASLAMELGAGRTFVGGRTDQLFEASTVASVGEYRMNHAPAESSDAIDLDYDPGSTHVRPWRLNNRADVRLHMDPVWDIRVDCGAARLEMDLRDHRVAKVDIDAGASSVELTLGGGVPETRVTVEAGASSVEISVPAESGCEVRFDGGLTSKHLDGFKKTGKGIWETDNYENAAEKIFVDIDAGVSRINVRRR